MNLVNKEVGKVEYRTLLAGNFPVEKRTITLKQPTEDLVFGSVIGLATADKKGALLKKTASDGTEKIYGILLHNVEKADADVYAVVAVTGDFAEDHLVFGAGTKADDVRADAEERNIYFHKVVNGNGEV